MQILNSKMSFTSLLTITITFILTSIMLYTLQKYNVKHNLISQFFIPKKKINLIHNKTVLSKKKLEVVLINDKKYYHIKDDKYILYKDVEIKDTTINNINYHLYEF